MDLSRPSSVRIRVVPTGRGRDGLATVMARNVFALSRDVQRTMPAALFLLYLAAAGIFLSETSRPHGCR